LLAASTEVNVCKTPSLVPKDEDTINARAPKKSAFGKFAAATVTAS
jgi:hypothetical protein